MNNHICPLAAHIRKMNPRDPALGFAINARIIRNGIPYGSEFSDDPKGRRGLLFACYQSSIDNGFRFLQKAWANKDDFPAKGAGFDAFIAQRPNNGKLTCAFEDKDNKIITPGLGEFSRLVTMKGGEYFFVPSISALTSTLGSA
jgi:Dyp-type peroxidase family